jgi:hypothetical protein
MKKKLKREDVFIGETKHLPIVGIKLEGKSLVELIKTKHHDKRKRNILTKDRLQ